MLTISRAKQGGTKTGLFAAGTNKIEHCCAASMSQNPHRCRKATHLPTAETKQSSNQNNSKTPMRVALDQAQVGELLSNFSYSFHGANIWRYAKNEVFFGKLLIAVLFDSFKELLMLSTMFGGNETLLRWKRFKAISELQGARKDGNWGEARVRSAK